VDVGIGGVGMRYMLRGWGVVGWVSG